MNQEILKADFTNARIGDRVKDLFNAGGTIKEIDTIKKIIKIYFDDNSPEFQTIVDFDFDGYPLENGIINTVPVLFYHFEGQFPTKEACTRPMPEIEVDTKVLVWSGTSWVNRHFARFENLMFKCFDAGTTSFTGENTTFFEYWKLADDPIINSGNLEELND